MKIKILILGSNGMAGHMISEYLSNYEDYEIIRSTRENLSNNKTNYTFDAINFSEFETLITKTFPDYVINAIGILNSVAENHPDNAILINTFLPHYFAKICNKYNAKLIHISTDCVFNGSKGSYLENDIKDGIGFYAQSKALGEVVYGNNITIRTSIIGPELKKNGIGLFDWIFKQENKIIGFAEAYWGGVTTLELAKAIHFIINNKYTNLKLVHLTNNNSINKFSLIEIINNVFKLGLNVVPDDKYKVDKSLKNSNTEFKYTVPSYEKMIYDLYEWMIKHKEIYINYKLK